MSKIIADFREKDIIFELQRKHIDVEVKSLISADFIIQVKDLNNTIRNKEYSKKRTCWKN